MSKDISTGLPVDQELIEKSSGLYLPHLTLIQYSLVLELHFCYLIIPKYQYKKVLKILSKKLE
jgi:hypothetical protein